MQEFDLGDVQVELDDGSAWTLHRRGTTVLPAGTGRVPVAFVLPLRWPACGESGPDVSYPCPEGTEVRFDTGYLGLARALAAAGYLPVVLDMNSIHTNPMDTSGAFLDESDGLDRLETVMTDLLSVLDIGSKSEELGDIAARADTRHVAVIGHSHGGELALQLPTVLDGRFDVLSVLAVVPSTSGISRPIADDVAVGVIVGTCDGTGVGVDGLDLWYQLTQRKAPASFLVLSGATHIGFVDHPVFDLSGAGGEPMCDGGGSALSAEDQQSWLEYTSVAWLNHTVNEMEPDDPWRRGSAVIGPNGAVVKRLDRADGGILIVADAGGVDMARAIGDASVQRCGSRPECTDLFGQSPTPGTGMWFVTSKAEGGLRFEVDPPVDAKSVSVLVGTPKKGSRGLTVVLEDFAGARSRIAIDSDHPAFSNQDVVLSPWGQQLILSQLWIPLSRASGIDSSQLDAVELVGDDLELFVGQVAIQIR